MGVMFLASKVCSNDSWKALEVYNPCGDVVSGFREH
jgi:hypothetical protein